VDPRTHDRDQLANAFARLNPDAYLHGKDVSIRELLRSLYGRRPASGPRDSRASRTSEESDDSA
jgi:hypothetical protein